VTHEPLAPEPASGTAFEADQRRGIKSFVLRQGRMSPAQTRAYETLLPRYGIAFSHTTVDLAELFARQAPTVLEIGFGMGETTTQIAERLPHVNFLGIEVHQPGVGALLKQVDTKHLTNVRVIRHDAIEVLQEMIGPNTLAGLHLFFPDPWPKKRHQKRRILGSRLLDLLATRLQVGAYIHMATDWQEYAENALATLLADARFENSSRLATGFAVRPEYRPVTKFEARGVRLGHGVWDIVFRLRPRE
jgi:tRNA (guanine-N7-)-methyltransferase